MSLSYEDYLIITHIAKFFYVLTYQNDDIKL